VLTLSLSQLVKVGPAFSINFFRSFPVGYPNSPLGAPWWAEINGVVYSASGRDFLYSTQGWAVGFLIVRFGISGSRARALVRRAGRAFPLKYYPTVL
jgi:hypothetical protein